MPNVSFSSYLTLQGVHMGCRQHGRCSTEPPRKRPSRQMTHSSTGVSIDNKAKHSSGCVTLNVSILYRVGKQLIRCLNLILLSQLQGIKQEPWFSTASFLTTHSRVRREYDLWNLWRAMSVSSVRSARESRTMGLMGLMGLMQTKGSAPRGIGTTSFRFRARPCYARYAWTSFTRRTT